MMFHVNNPQGINILTTTERFYYSYHILLGPINTRTGNYSAKYLFYRYDDVVAMILPVTGFRLECAKINRVESDNYPQ